MKDIQEACLPCGQCCKILLIPTRFEWADEDSKRFYEVRGLTIVEDNMGGITIVISSPCPKWEDGKGCKRYGDRPYWCKVYVAKDDPILYDVCALAKNRGIPH